MIEGIRINKQQNITICIIDYLSNQFEGILRRSLTNICYGRKQSEEDPTSYSYEYTLKQLLLRFSSKSRSIQIGMIGELLSHILLVELYTNLTSVNLYFNLEERSIKKGFDLILYETQKQGMWITEVKSGEIDTNRNIDRKNTELLNSAKRDLTKRLNESTDNLWHNAVHSALISLKENDEKNAVIQILRGSLKESQNNSSTSLNKNVVLTSVIFCDTSREVTLDNVVKFHSKTILERKFSDFIAISMQEKSIDEIVNFLVSEVSK